MQGQALPGFRDFYPDELALRNYIFAMWREVARRYGFQEYDGPPLEPLELYTGKSGAEIVQQLYAFEDKGGRKVALRPEMTPTLARMVGARAQALKKPIRWFSIPQLFRYERQQRGRLREHFQLNMDIIGEAGPAADAEIMAAVIDIARGFGFGPKDVRLRISDRQVLRTLLLGHGLSEAQLPAAYAAIDKLEREPRHDLIEKMKLAFGNPAAILEIAALRGIGAVTAALGKVKGGEDAGRPLAECVSALKAMGGEDVEPVLRLAAQLRERGVAAEYALRNQPIRKQLELAAARGAPRAVIIGPDERKAKIAVVRDLKTGKQRKVSLTKVRKGVFK